jgi:mannose-6-phosphate isomerase-like protein (cupin superfamily)
MTTAAEATTEEAGVKPQIFSLKTPMVSKGQIDNFVAETDLMKVSIKIYAEGGENFFHTHTTEDHFFVILDGEATFRDPWEKSVTLQRYQGIMLPRGCYYMFTNTGDKPLVLLRCGATTVPWAGDNRKWWQNVVDTRPNMRGREAIVPGSFFAPESGMQR